MKDMFGQELFVGATIAYAVREGNTAVLKAAQVIEVHTSSIKVCSYCNTWWQHDHVYITNLANSDRIVRCEISDEASKAINTFLNK